MATPDTALYLGLISGTSADGIDAALVRFSPRTEILAAATTPYSATLREQLLALTAPGAAIPLDALGALDVEVGRCFADAALALIASAGLTPADVLAIGSHGQTIRHRGTGTHPFSMQIGDPSVIAERTGVCTVADVRSADVAAGGQGAPLAPGVHAALFADRAPCAVLNLGGIANLTLLGADGAVLGFDTGPANGLLDAWHARHRDGDCDRDGAWAATGRADTALLEVLLAESYFSAPAPKSTGREVFNLAWVEARADIAALDPADVQATLLALSARTIADALRREAPPCERVYACGGGVHNGALMRAIAADIAPATLTTTGDAGVDPDVVEAVLLAWLARERIAERPGNVVTVTGARGPRLLGAIHDGRGIGRPR
ncbi:anhydro-N-acetylmuramic acid kinase [Dokdonella sp. MW10]|uniref:anhydro-N-acetylmuramic acid kinase n=1 Tax=Dokdonella sp. MW10 TaxID=2992926 RepID=UPI003F7EF830